MAFESLQAVIATAVINSEFRQALLNGSRRRVVSDFGLSSEEINAIMSIRAATLEQFAGQLDRWIMRKLNRIDPPELVLPVRTLPRHEEAETRRELAPIDDSLLPLFAT